ncbi:hypothetical protein HU200_019254 [Digitaria exilis]|uniref:Uncharacterized protein n=1 Tax=Digitaria exilis TaxID=1010633 RepID=A0A835KFG3_9POAL|nr:hypothetical protein HU200_019254 [Digitaria exilis]
MYMTSPSPPPQLAAGITPAPMDTGSRARSTRQSAAPHSRRTAYPQLLPLQYARHTVSSTSFLPPQLLGPAVAVEVGVGSAEPLARSHSSAMRTRPEAISRTSAAVGAASSSSSAGHARGSTWNASVPVSRAPRPTWRCRPAMALASAERRRDTAVRTFLLLGGCCCCGGAVAAAAAFRGGDTKSSEWKDGQAEENAMVASSSSSASEFFMYSSSPNVAPWLLLLPRTGHLKWRLEKESESWGFLAVMVLMVLAVFYYQSSTP